MPVCSGLSGCNPGDLVFVVKKRWAANPLAKTRVEEDLTIYQFSIVSLLF
jgi:hypothetical protein